ncbi:MAG: PSD1 and planctomycete cytochrome C domain-containing protein [Planctomyces sp.]
MMIHRVLRHFTLSTCCLYAALGACGSVAAADKSNTEDSQSPSEHEQHFREKVLPVLKQNCVKCHSGKEPKGGLRMTDRDGILKGGESGAAFDAEKPEASLLVSAVTWQGLEMPPTGRMSQKDIDAVTEWVKNGATWPDDVAVIAVQEEHGPPQVNEETRRFWSFQPVKRPEVPAEISGNGFHAAHSLNEIDRFINAALHAKGLSPVPAASPQQLIRRASYDLTGLPPSLEDVEAFAANPTQEAWHRVIDRLLESPHYGERWGRHWLDVVRYAETNSYERDGAKPHVWRYRDYVIQSLNADKPYDRFVLEQLAGDELPDRNAESIIATGYYRLGRWDDEPVDHEVAFFDDMDDILTTTSQTFLGLTINCARCHDHKIDPIPQSDYYRMLGFFQNVRRFGVRSPESVLDASVTDIDQPEDRQILADKMARYEKEMADVLKSLTEFDERLKPDLAGGERDDFQDETSRVRLMEKREGTRFSPDEVKRYRNLTKRRDDMRAHRPTGMGQALCVKEDLKNPRPVRVLLRGNPHSPGPEVTPGFPTVLSPPEVAFPEVSADAVSSGRRTVAARWIASAENPLTARVAVNRIWQHHFGRGIVRTSSDFGFQGARPTHPELLDWLASEFVRQGWSMKKLHRLIMQSAAYQRSSTGDSVALSSDPENLLFWRFDMRRLSAEEIRDSILAASGSLNTRDMYGPSVFSRMPDEVKAGQSVPGAGWGESSPEQESRRSIYIHAKRSLLDPLLEGFDLADTDQSCPVRFSTTQPTQALALLNSDFILRQAEIFAKQISTQSSDLREQVRLALQRVTQRRPTAEEIEQGLRLIESLQKDQSMSPEKARIWFCLMALNLNEMVYLD